MRFYSGFQWYTIEVPKQGVRFSARIRANVKTASMAQNDINDHLIQKSKQWKVSLK